ncbi:MAG: hypothetical protein NTZ80_01030 [Patescibacteria group bacterium]|nr:hypothetical protein [Patescibacteria group bacterium]
MKKINIAIVLSILAFALVGCGEANTIDKVARNCALMLDQKTCREDVMLVIAKKDFQTLSTLIHPWKHLRFSPEPIIEEGTDLTFTSDDIAKISSDSRTYLWSKSKSFRKPLLLNFDEYWNQFVYDHDYLNASEKPVFRNLSNDSKQDIFAKIYPNAEAYDYYFSDSGSNVRNLNQTSLRLVFDKYEDNWTLVAIAHSQGKSQIAKLQ